MAVRSHLLGLWQISWVCDMRKVQSGQIQRVILCNISKKPKQSKQASKRK